MLRVSAPLVALLSAGCMNSGSQGGDSEPTDSPTKSFKLGGKTGGWVGQAPTNIEGKTNPSLQFQAGTTYELTWENLDGAEHELIIEDKDGNELEATESASQKGETRTITFEATDKMAQYYCEYHPQSMRGSIELGGG